MGVGVESVLLHRIIGFGFSPSWRSRTENTGSIGRGFTENDYFPLEIYHKSHIFKNFLFSPNFCPIIKIIFVGIWNLQAKIATERDLWNKIKQSKFTSLFRNSLSAKPHSIPLGAWPGWCTDDKKGLWVAAWIIKTGLHQTGIHFSKNYLSLNEDFGIENIGIFIKPRKLYIDL